LWQNITTDIIIIIIIKCEDIDRLTSGYYVLAKSEHVVLHDKISTRLHSLVCN